MVAAPAPRSRRRRIAFVHNFASHYTEPMFRLLAERYDVDFYFHSQGGERYWLSEHGVRRSLGTYLPGFHVGGVWVTPTLGVELLRHDYEAVVKGISGKVALSTTFLATRARRTPLVLWTGMWSRLETAVHRATFPLTRAIYRHADAVVTYGTHVRAYVASEGVAPEKIFVAPHAVDNAHYGRPVTDAERAAVREGLGVGADTPVVLFLGRLEAGKGLDDLLTAFARVDSPDAVLVLAGAGSERERLRRSAVELGLANRVRFPGYVPPDRAPAHYAAATIFVLPSVTTPTFKEPWGLVVNEAFDQGLPVVASTAVGAVAGGLLRHEDTGLVFPERDRDALRDALARLLGEPDLRARLGARARAEVARWTQAGMVDGFERAIEFAVDRRGDARR